MNKYASRALPLDGGFIKVISYRSDAESNNDQWRRFLAAFFFVFFLSGLSSCSVLAGGARPTPTDRGEKKRKGLHCARVARRSRRASVIAGPVAAKFRLISPLCCPVPRSARRLISRHIFNFFFFGSFFSHSFDLFLQTFLRLLQLNGKKNQNKNK